MIKLTHISKTYGTKQLFNHLNVHINTGEKVLLRTPSGSGKTTLIRLIMGFEKPDSGDIYIDNVALNKHTLKSIREKIAYVSQDADLELSTVAKMLELVFCYKANRHITDYKEKFSHYQILFSLEDDILEKDIKNISGGERQRIALIIALILDRPYMILDEITSGLDASIRSIIHDHIISIPNTVIVLSHDEIWHTSQNFREVALHGTN